MPEAGNYLLANAGFSSDQQPVISLLEDDRFVDLFPVGHVITLRFDTSQRFCVGGFDITSGERFACADHLAVDAKYDQCQACRQRTGFNPAFYNAATVSKQQEARNLRPHFLYLAHFGTGIIKVGISYADRKNSRLLEQGARSALILETFPTALIARQYEARIAALPNIAETIQLQRKISLLQQPYDHAKASEELLQTRNVIEKTLGISFASNHVLAFDTVFFPHETVDMTEAHDMTEQHIISGYAAGMMGSLLFCRQGENTAFFPLKKYTGYNVSLSYEETSLSFPARQISLF